MLIKTLRKTFASVAVMALVLSAVIVPGMGSHLAQAQSDDWWQPFLDTAEDLGVGDNTVDPSAMMTRYEFAQLALNAGLVGGSIFPEDLTSDHTFGDVIDPAYVEAVATLQSLDVVQGKEQADGSRNFDGSSYITKEEQLKIVMILEGLVFQDEEGIEYDTGFTDVPKDSWYATYVGVALEEGLVRGEGGGTTFGAGANVNNAVGYKLTLSVLSVADEDTGEALVTQTLDEVVGSEDTVVTVGGDLEVSISSRTPDVATVPSQATSVPFSAFDFTAGAEDAVIAALVVHRYGVSASSAFDGVYLYDDNGNRLTSQKTVNSDTNDVTFSNVNISVPSGETVTLWILADIADLSSTGEGQFGFETADQVDAGDGVVSGDFPVLGNKLSLSTTDAGSITISKTGTVTNPTLGSKGVKIAEFKLEASSEAANLSQINLKVKGTIDDKGITNLELRTQTGDVLSTVAGLNSESLATFVFNDPYSIPDGSSRTFRVYADVLGDVAETIQVYLDEDTDLVALGGDYGFGMAVTRTTYDGGSCTSSAGDCSYSALEGGNVTFAFQGPVAGDVSVDGENVTILEFTLTSLGAITVKDLDVIVYGDDDGDNDPFDGVDDGTDTDDDGLIVGSGTNEAALTDIKIVDLDTGNTLMGPLELDGVADTNDDASQTIDFTDDFDMAAGQSLNLAVVVDIDNNVAANTEFGATVDISGFLAEDENGDDVVSSEIVPSSDLQGNAMKATSPSLTMALASTPVSDTEVKGSADVDTVGINFTAGDSEDITVTALTLQGYLDIDSDTYNDGGDGIDNGTNLQDFIEGVYLYVDGTKLAGPESVESDGDVVFSSLEWVVPNGETKKMVVKVKLAKPSAVSSDLIAFGIAATTDITAQDQDGDSVTTGLSTINTSQTVAITVNNAGSLSLTEEGSPSAKIIVGGKDDVLVSKYKFNAVDEQFKITDLDIFTDTNSDSTDAEATYARAIDSLKLQYVDSNGDTVTKSGSLSAGKATMSDLDILVDKDKSAYVEIYIDSSTIQAGAVSGDKIRLVINENLTVNNLEAVGQGSGVTLTESDITLPTNESNVEAHYLRETEPVIAKASGISTIFVNGQNTVYAFTVAADSAEAVAWKSVRIKMAYNRDANNDGNLGTFEFFRGTTNISDDVSIVSLGDSNVADNTDFEAASTDGVPGTGDDSATSFNGYVVVTFNDAATSEEVISAGSTETYYLKATASSVDNSGDSVSASIEDDTFAVTNFAGVGADFEPTRIKYITQSGDDDALIYDVNGDTTAVASAICANTSDDILLGKVGGTDVSIATDITDCDTVTALTSTTLAYIKTLTDNGDADDSIVYDTSNDTAAGLDGAVYNNTSDDIWIIAAAAASTAGGALPADSDAAAPAALDRNLLYLVIDAGSADTIAYSAAGNIAAANGAVCTNAGILAGGITAAADCEVVSNPAGPSVNFVWSDNSSTTHSTTTSDWTTGYLVDDLASATHVLTY